MHFSSLDRAFELD